TTTPTPLCPKCGCDDASLLEASDRGWFCNVCSNTWQRAVTRKKFASLDDLIARTGLRRDEVVTLADVGALNSFGYDRRSALWQAERGIRPAGELFREAEHAESEFAETADAPLKPMTESERIVADFAGMGLSIGRHPMALRRDELAMRGLVRAIDLRAIR